MKLFLSSLAISDLQAMELAKLVGKEQKDIKLALIENATDADDEPKINMIANRATMQSHDFTVELVDIRQYRGKIDRLKTLLATKDVIWCGGGNTYYLRWLLKDTGVDKLIIELVDQGIVYGGDSAGAVIVGPTLKHFETGDDPSKAPELVVDGLNLTSSVVVPHMDNEKFASVIGAINDELIADNYKTVPLGDAQAFIVDGDSEKVI